MYVCILRVRYLQLPNKSQTLESELHPMLQCYQILKQVCLLLKFQTFAHPSDFPPFFKPLRILKENFPH